MKRKLLRQLLVIVAFLACQAGYAKESPRPSGERTVVTSATNFAFTDETYCQKTDQCFSYTYKGYKLSTDGQKVTLTFTVKNNSGYNLTCVSFELPSCKAVPVNSCKYQYLTYLAYQPFYCLKYVNLSWFGCKSGNEETFCYTILKSDFDKLKSIRVQAKTCLKESTVSFDKDCNIPKCQVAPEAVTNVTYTVDGVVYTPTSSNMSSLFAKAVKQGKPVKVCFTAPATTGYKTYSLISYTSPYPDFVKAEAHLQKVFDYKTITVGPEGGNICLEIKVPNCYFQVDFVKGCIITTLGPADTNPNNFYTEQHRLIAHANDGTVACTCINKPTGNQGCNPGCWKQKEHYCYWSCSKPTSTAQCKFFDVFTSFDCDNNTWSCRGLSKDLTMLDALNLSGSDFNNLASQAAAAYLNAKDPNVKFSMTAGEVVKGVINAFKTGNTFILAQLTTANSKGCPHSVSTTATTTSSLRVAEKPEVLAEQKVEPLTAYPNPFTVRADVRFALRNAENYTISLFSVSGKQIRQLKTGSAKAGETVSVNVNGAGLANGLYLVRLVTKSETQTLRLVLNR